MYCEYHRGCILPCTIRYRPPRYDWCMEESSTPISTTPMRILWCQRSTLSRKPFHGSFSMTAGANSKVSTVVYVMMQTHTSNSTELWFHITMGCQKRQGSPIS